MKIELPDFLIAMSEQMNNQDTRHTSDVIYQVRQKQYVVTEEGYNEHHFILADDDGEFFRSDKSDEKYAKNYIFENYEEACSDWVALKSDHKEINERGVEELFQEKFNFSEYLSTDLEDLGIDVRKLAVQQIEVVLYTCFTEKEALAIAQRYHESTEVYTYGISLYASPETRQLRNWIESLTAAEVKA